MSKKSRFFRVAVEGATSDGRTIDRDWLLQIAKHYNPKVYGARVNMEHIRGYGPNSDFRAYGDVLAVKTEEVDIGGQKKLALLAQAARSVARRVDVIRMMVRMIGVDEDKPINALPAVKRAEKARNYFELAFFSGMRPSEQIAMQWSKVDLKAGKMLVDAARTRGEEKGTKTGNTRTVELTANALEALRRQKTSSHKNAVYVFETEQGKPFGSTDIPLDSWWRPTVSALGLRYRDARQTRHTFATMCLMAGITPGWVAMQMGHSIEMFFRVYSRWIQGADQGAERRKLDAFIAGS
ncbi:GPO family capsid scaffolding protein [Comamonas testosteroni]|uniref:GPO family capsid scaffolding protein n=1 Tax=Comamonas testosteroni TaxID=285 RepID=UPI000A7DDFF4|nr:GPO family capsid scaffolding protein [Comamonas testosteroni]